MKRLILLALFPILSCASAPKWHDYEGPMRLRVRIPPTIMTSTNYTIEMKVLGIIPSYIEEDAIGICLVFKLDGEVVNTSCIDYLGSRTVRIPFSLSDRYYILRKGWDRNVRELGTEDVPLGAYNVEQIDGDYDTVRARIEIEMWEAEPHPTKPLEWKPADRLCSFSRSITVDCVRCVKPMMH